MTRSDMVIEIFMDARNDAFVQKMFPAPICTGHYIYTGMQVFRDKKPKNRLNRIVVWRTALGGVRVRPPKGLRVVWLRERKKKL